MYDTIQELAAALCKADRLKAALRDAITECREHNNEYHHRTKEEKLVEWENLVGK